MFKNYIMIALRNLTRNKTYSLINIGGLALGMAIFVFASVLANYEKTHDVFFDKADRIYSLGSVFSAAANAGVKESDGVRTALAPLLEADAPDVEATARTVQRKFLLSIGDRNFYQTIRFTDKAFLDIFDFDFLAGDKTALNDPTGIVLTETLANKYFPQGNAMGKVISLDHKHDLRVTAIIRDLPRNSHFVSSLFGVYLEAFAPLEALNHITGYDLAGNWSNLSGADYTYVLLPPHLDAEWLEGQANGVLARHAPEDEKKLIAKIKVRRLQDINLVLWEMVGWPVIEAIVVMGFLVLIIAGLNYTNLATAQAMGRAKEVGLRKTMGANTTQLLTQFLVESVSTAMLAMIVALGVLEIIIPAFNGSLGKTLVLDYAASLPSLVGVTLLVGLVAGIYPAYVITKVKPVEALHGGLTKGSKGSFVRSFMIGAQFVFSVFMLAMVSVVYFQNEQIEKSSNIFPKSQIVTLQRMGVSALRDRHDTLKLEIENIPGVESVSYSNQVPFEQNNRNFTVTKNSGDEAGKVMINSVIVDYDFIKTYDVPIVAGRDFSKEFANDLGKSDAEVTNVIVNELLLKRLGFTSSKEAVNQTFHQFYRDKPESGIYKSYMIVGVMTDQNFLGLHNSVKPMIFWIDPRYYSRASIRISGDNFTQTLVHLEEVWQKVNPDFPIQIKFLDAIFEDIFKINRAVNMTLAGFAVLAMTLAFIGLFGLAAFMAERRTKEIGIRKVMGAQTYQIVRLLIWQFSRPVVWALVLALPLSYFTANLYLNFFAERIETTGILIAGSGLMAVVLAWVIVSAHAFRVSRRKPIHALRYE